MRCNKTWNSFVFFMPCDLISRLRRRILMKKILLIGLLLLIGCGGKVGKVREPSPLITHMGASTVALMATKGDNARPYCTGVWVSKDVILTANHCVEAAWEMELEKKIDKLDPSEQEAAIKRYQEMSHSERQGLVVEGTPIRYIVEGDVDEIGKPPFAIRLGVVLAVSPSHDLALVEASGRNLPAHDIAYVGDENPAIGERVSVVGQVKGLYWTYVEGTVAQYRNDIPERLKPVSEVNEIGFVGPYLQVSAPVWYGNSGGGAFDMDGHLVGIASFMTGAPHSCYFIHADVIRAMLAKHMIQ